MANPLAEAVRKISDKTPIGSILTSAEWRGVPLALRERAFFSAGVESARFLATAQSKLKSAISLQKERVARGDAFVDRSSFIADMRQIAIEEGIFVDPLKKGGLQDITSRKRLGLIFDMQDQQAKDFARWKIEQDPDVLDAFPAQEFLRLETRLLPRGGQPDSKGVGVFWRNRWASLGGQFFDGRMIALKNDPIWRRLSLFGAPWLPYAYGSGMGLEDVDRDQAEALGLIQPGETITPGEDEFNDHLQASVRGLKLEFKQALKSLFKDQITIDGDVVRWTGQKPAPEPLPRPDPVAEPETYNQIVAALTEIGQRETVIEADFAAAQKSGDMAALMEISVRRAKVVNEARNAVSVPMAQRGKVGFANKSPKAIREKIEQGAAITERYVHADLLPKNITVKAIKGRAHYRAGMIAIAPHNPASVVAHELVHDIEPHHAHVAASTKAFLQKRAEGKPAQSLRLLTGIDGYRWDEVTFEDQWRQRGGSLYSGKLYPGPYTELLTMGIERLHQSPGAFLAQDPDYFEFVVKTLRKW